jgi:hypothetical protein
MCDISVQEKIINLFTEQKSSNIFYSSTHGYHKGAACPPRQYFASFITDAEEHKNSQNP